MSELSQATPDLDTRLQEIDRSLREIQAGLLPARTPPGIPDDGPREDMLPDDGPREPWLEPEPEPPEPEPPEPMAPEPGPPEPGPPEPMAPEPGVEHPRRGRSGPLAALLQRSAGEDPGPGDRPNPDDHLDPGDDPGDRVAPGDELDAGDEPRRRAAGPGRPPTDSIDQIVALTELHVKLLEAYQLVLAELRPERAAAEPPAPEHAAPEPAPAPSTVAEVTLSVGPFRSTDAVRAFARALSGIPGVREVAVRGYDGESRAIVDVHLAEPTS